MDESSDGKCSLAPGGGDVVPCGGHRELCALGEDGPALLRLSILPGLGHVPATCTGVSSALCSFLDWHR